MRRTLAVVLLLVLGCLLIMNQGRAATVISLANSAFHSLESSQTSPTSLLSDSHVMGSPTISEAFINKVLATYHSPATGTGEALFTDGRHYHIDPVYALAFFLHESLFGTTGIARHTRSLGNIRCSAGYRCIEGYRAYPRWEDGYLDWYQLILYGYVQGSVTRPLVGHVCSTLSQIIPVYAPSSDGNDVEDYIHAVEHAVSTWRSGKIEVTT